MVRLGNMAAQLIVIALFGLFLASSASKSTTMTKSGMVPVAKPVAPPAPIPMPDKVSKSGKNPKGPQSTKAPNNKSPVPPPTSPVVSPGKKGKEPKGSKTPKGKGGKTSNAPVPAPYMKPITSPAPVQKPINSTPTKNPAKIPNMNPTPVNPPVKQPSKGPVMPPVSKPTMTTKVPITLPTATKAPAGSPSGTTSAPFIIPTATNPPTRRPTLAPFGGPQNAWINEFHYDNAGTDVGEFVEVLATGNLDIAGWTVVVYNGANGADYDTLSLSTGSPVGNGVRISIVYSNAAFQNGPPDGFALVDGSGNVIEFISYEGTFTATTGPAAGMTSKDVGVSESGNDPPGLSLQLIGAGCSINSFTWTGPVAQSPGAINAGQAINC